MPIRPIAWVQSAPVEFPLAAAWLKKVAISWFKKAIAWARSTPTELPLAWKASAIPTFYMETAPVCSFANILYQICLAIARPDLALDDSLYNMSPYEMSDVQLVGAAANIFDCTEAEVVEYAGRHAGQPTSFERFFKEGKLPPMVRQWLRENFPSL